MTSGNGDEGWRRGNFPDPDFQLIEDYLQQRLAGKSAERSSGGRFALTPPTCLVRIHMDIEVREDVLPEIRRLVVANDGKELYKQLRGTVDETKRGPKVLKAVLGL